MRIVAASWSCSPAWCARHARGPPISSGVWAIDRPAWDQQLDRHGRGHARPDAARGAGADEGARHGPGRRAQRGGRRQGLDGTIEFLPGGMVRTTASPTAPATTGAGRLAGDGCGSRSTMPKGWRRWSARSRATGSRCGRSSRATTPTRRSCARWSPARPPPLSSTRADARTKKRPPSRAGRQSLRGTMELLHSTTPDRAFGSDAH